MLKCGAATHIEKIQDYNMPIDSEFVYEIIDSMKENIDEDFTIDCIVTSNKFFIRPDRSRVLIHVGSSKNLSIEEIRYASEIIDKVFEKIEETLDITKGKDDDG